MDTTITDNLKKYNAPIKIIKTTYLLNTKRNTYIMFCVDLFKLFKKLNLSKNKFLFVKKENRESNFIC